MPRQGRLDMLNKEKAAFQPFEGKLSMYLSVWAGFTSFHIRRADQYFQAFEHGIWLGCLLDELTSVVIVCHNVSPLKLFQVFGELIEGFVPAGFGLILSAPAGMPTCRRVSLVLPSCSSNVTVTSNSNGKSALMP